MRSRHVGYAALLFFCLCSMAVAGEPWPRLLGGQNSRECRAAFRLATMAYKSNSFTLWEPQEIPQDFDSTLVLGPGGIDLSGGNALDVDSEVFSKVPLPEYSVRSVYWQTQPGEALRLVVEEIPHGWRGDAYAVHVLDTQVTVADFFAGNRGGKYQTLVGGGWRPPLVFKSMAGARLWMVFVGEPYVFSPDWRVYVSDGEGFKKACDIQFRPDVKNAALLLPSPIRRLGSLLDRSIGSGKDEGTLQPTARIRINVQQALANAALRPWAMSEPFNSREEVDAALMTWASQEPSNARALKAMRKYYPVAERAFADYYVRRFNMSRQVAASTAKSILDNVFRTHYVFHRERP